MSTSKTYNVIFHESKSFRKVMVFPNIQFTPELAAEFLMLNEINRPLRSQTVGVYAEQMKAGKWQFAGDSVRISKTAKLIDGQHRLQAIVKSNTTQTFNVQTGLEDESFQVMDIGRLRTGGDTVAMHGLKNYQHIASLIRALIQYDEGKLSEFLHGHVKAASNTDIDKYLTLPATNLNLMQEAISYGTKFYSRFKALSPSWYAFFIYALSPKHYEKIVEFFDLVTSGENIGLDRHPAAFVLRTNFIKMMSTTSKKSSINAIYKIAITIKAWNFFLKSRTVKVISWNESEDFPTLLMK